MSTAIEPVVVGEEVVSGQGASLWRDTLKSILRQRSAIVGIAILIVIILAAVFAAQISPYEPNQIFLGDPGAIVRAGPCIHLFGCPAAYPEHFFGLDGNGRDVFTRILYGGRLDLFIGIVVVGIAIVAGTLIGAVSGYFGGRTDNILMRVMDTVLAFPSLLLAIAIVTVLGEGLLNAMMAIGIVAIPIYARVMRASVLTIREADFVTASRALGESSGGILLRRILPNALTPLIVQGTLGIGSAIIDVAALSFLSLGVQLPTAEWGVMIGTERNSVFAAPHLVLFPGLAIVLTVLAFNLVGDGVRDALDPRLNR